MAPNYTRLFGSIMLSVLLVIIAVHLSHSCNEEVCAPIVSKCMLTQSCKCSLKNYTCHSECFKCLGHLSTECCSCVEMCKKTTASKVLSDKSHVEDLEGVPGLFEALTAGNNEDDVDKWTIFTFPMEFEKFSGKEKKTQYALKSKETDVDASAKANQNSYTLNCTVAYMSQCLSSNKCKQNCESMGASYFRWFFDGCCECVGETCIHYGDKKSKCAKCPPPKDELLDDLPDEALDFGESNVL